VNDSWAIKPIRYAQGNRVAVHVTQVFPYGLPSCAAETVCKFVRHASILSECDERIAERRQQFGRRGYDHIGPRCEDGLPGEQATNLEVCIKLQVLRCRRQGP